MSSTGWTIIHELCYELYPPFCSKTLLCTVYSVSKLLSEAARAHLPLTLARQPRDGLCCFHAFAYGLADGTCAHGLRRSIASAIRSRSGQRVLYGSRAIRIVKLVSSCALGRRVRARPRRSLVVSRSRRARARIALESLFTRALSRPSLSLRVQLR